MPEETLSWANQTTGADGQLADFTGISWTASDGGGPGSGSIMVNATLLDGTDVFAAQTTNGINGTSDNSTLNTGELVTSGNYAGNAPGWLDNSALILRNIEGDGASGTGATETVSLQLDFTTNDPSLYSDGVDSISFWINDIDTLSWDDEIEIFVYDTAGNPLAASSVSFASAGSNVTADNTGVPAVITSNGASISPDDPAGALQVIVDDPTVAVGKIVITYNNLGTSGQLVEISDLTMFTMPVPPCFTSGTYILTENGEVKIEDLVEGDLIVTAGNGLVPVRWISKRTVSATGDFAPIMITKGSLGNTRDLMVSPAHRMVVSDARVSALFSDDEVLVAAKSLIDGDRIYRKPGGMVTYFHILFDEHEVVFADGAPAESLYLGQSALTTFSEDTQAEVLALFPELNGGLPSAGALARPILNAAEAVLLSH